jgi:hypothetical protein
VVQLLANASYLVECFWPDIDRQRVQHAAERLAACAAESGRDGCPVAYIGSIEMPDDDVIFFVFEAGSASEVERICGLAQLQFERVVRSVVSAH